MARKEHKGRILNNKEVERDNKAKGKNVNDNVRYSGIQDTGDQKIRGMGSEVQQKSGFIDNIDKNEAQ